MKLQKIYLENFKCFNNIEIEFGKITLLTGANSSGKSSIIYGILAALQSDEFPFQFSPNGLYVEMGDFQKISKDHNKKNIIKINLKSDDKDSLEINTSWAFDRLSKLPLLNELFITSNYFNLRITRKLDDKLFIKYEPLKEDVNIEEIDKITFEILKLLENASTLKDNNDIIYNDFKEKFLKRNIFEFSVDNITEINKHIQSNFYLLNDFNKIKTFFTEIKKEINYISSFRLYPERNYYEKTDSNLKIGKSGEKYIDQILQWETNKSKKFNEMIKILKKLELLDNIRANRIQGGLFDILIKTKKNKTFSSLADVGFGVSQILPIIVADLQLESNSTLIISQPEIHLHPCAQASFATYIINQLKNKNKNYIIETHSEYLLNRIRNEIVKDEVKSEDIKAYYLQNNGTNVIKNELSFSKSGEILNAPDDFFKTYMLDVMEIALNAE